MSTAQLLQERTAATQPQTVAPSPSEVMLRTISGFWVARAIHIVAELGIADLVAHDAKTAEELAKATSTHPEALYRVLRALASLGIFVEDGQQRFGLTPLARTLQTDAPGSLRFLALLVGGEEQYESWGELSYSVQTGKRAFEHVFSTSPFEYFARKPECAELFHRAMDNITGMTTKAILAAYDFSEFGKIVDVGGGQGALISLLLAANKNAKGVLFDQPHVVAGARTKVASAGLAERCEILSGSFLESVPSGGDLYVLKAIILDWNDKDALSILKNVHRAMGAGSHLLVIEPLVSPPNQPGFGKLLDLNMLVMNGGKNRTENEHRALLREAGFQQVRIIPTQSPFSLVEAQRR